MDFFNRLSNPLSVLVAESHPAIRRNLSEALRGMGLSTYEASGGQETLEIVSTVRVHALILDYDLPDLGGLQTVRVMRTFREVPPYLLLASAITREMQVDALASHATSVIPKPVDMDMLSDIVETMLLRAYNRF